VSSRRPVPHGGERPAEHCADEVCVTCSDEAVPVRVVRLLEDGLAEADTGKGIEEISVALVDVRPGDMVLVHAKEAIAVEASTLSRAGGRAVGRAANGG
jgi:hydrogenase expression/formation protein HypC